MCICAITQSGHKNTLRGRLEFKCSIMNVYDIDCQNSSDEEFENLGEEEQEQERYVVTKR